MLGLLLKDFYALRTYFKRQALVMILAYAVLSILLQSMSFLSSMLVMYGMMVYMTTFSVDEACQWNAYACTLPVTPRAAVAARLIVLLMMIWGVGLAATVIPLPFQLMLFDGSVLESFASFAALAFIYTVVGTISLPVFYKVGPERARMITTLMFILPFMAVIWIASAWEAAIAPLFDWAAFNWPLFLAACALFLVLMCVGSFFAAVRIYRKKEF